MLVLAPEFYRPLRALGAAFHAGMAGKEAAVRIAEVLEAEEPLAAPAITRAESGARGEEAGVARPRDRIRERPPRLCAGSGARARRFLARAARRHDRRPGGPERRGQDDGRPAPPAVPRARRGARSPSTVRRSVRWRRRSGGVAWRGCRSGRTSSTARVRENLLLGRPDASAAEIDERRGPGPARRRPARAAARLGHAGGRGRRAALGRPGPAPRSRAGLPEGRARAGARRAHRPTRPGERSRRHGSDRRPAPRKDGAARRPPPDHGDRGRTAWRSSRTAGSSRRARRADWR